MSCEIVFRFVLLRNKSRSEHDRFLDCRPYLVSHRLIILFKIMMNRFFCECIELISEDITCSTAVLLSILRHHSLVFSACFRDSIIITRHYFW